MLFTKDGKSLTNEIKDLTIYKSDKLPTLAEKGGLLNADEAAMINSEYFNGAYKVIEKEFTQSIISLENQESGKLRGSIKGNTLYNAIIGGDFVSTTGWATVGSTLSVSNKILIVTGNGSTATVGVSKKSIGAVGKKYTLKGRFRVTDSNALNIKIRFADGSVETILNSPIQNQWYDIKSIGICGSPILVIFATYSDVITANGKVLEVDGNTGVFAIPISNTPYENWTADQINNMIDGYWEGLRGTQPSKIKIGQTELNYPVPLNRVSTTAFDEFDFDGKLTQRTAEKLNQTGVVNYVDMATSGNFIAQLSTGTVQIGVKGDVLTATATKIIYQLATPVETQYQGADFTITPHSTIYTESVIAPTLDLQYNNDPKMYFKDKYLLLEYKNISLLDKYTFKNMMLYANSNNFKVYLYVGNSFVLVGANTDSIFQKIQIDINQKPASNIYILLESNVKNMSISGLKLTVDYDKQLGLIEHTPRYYLKSETVNNIYGIMDLENDEFVNLIAEYVNQFIVSTATFALDRYEEQYGLDVNPQGITTEERRSRIKAKMRSVGVVNKTMIQNMVNAWTNATIEVIEDYANYSIVIRFISVYGRPSNMDDVYKAINEIKPAHLNFKYEFRYMSWNEFDNYNKTWNQWDALNLTWDAWEEYREVI